MQLLRLTRESVLTSLPETVMVCHDVRNPSLLNQVLIRKGTNMQSARVRELLQDGIAELHVAVAAEGDVGEDEAAIRLANAVVGSGVEVGPAHFGQVGLTSAQRGMLRVDHTSVNEINACDGALVITAEPDRPVDAGTTVGVIKCAPLFLGEGTLQTVQAVRISNGPSIALQPFVPTRVALIAPAERLRGGAMERAHAALEGAVEWYGSSLEVVVGAEATVEAMTSAYRQAVDRECQLIFAAGAAGTDPLDVVFDGLRQAGGRVEQMGIPLEPGTACWTGSLADTSVLGLASCELFGRPGALDLLLPRFFAGERIDAPLLRKLAVGGLLLGPPRIAPYHTLENAADDAK